MADFRWLTPQETRTLIDRVTWARICQRPSQLNRLLNGIEPGHRAQFLPDLAEMDTSGISDRLESHCEHLSTQEPLADNSAPIAVFLANVTRACHAASLSDAIFRDLLRRCLAVAREADGEGQDEREKWEGAARFIEAVIAELPPIRTPRRLETITTETIGRSHGSPGLDAVERTDAALAPVESKGSEDLTKLLEQSQKITRVSQVIPDLELYISKYKEALEPLMCCENIVKATEKLRSTIEYVDDAEWANASRPRWAFAAKANEINDLLALPCVDELRGWTDGLPPQVDGTSAEIMARYEQSCQQARQEAAELTNSMTADDRRQLLAVVRRMSTHALIMKSSWQVPHDAIYTGIVRKINSMSTIIGI